MMPPTRIANPTAAMSRGISPHRDQTFKMRRPCIEAPVECSLLVLDLHRCILIEGAIVVVVPIVCSNKAELIFDLEQLRTRLEHLPSLWIIRHVDESISHGRHFFLGYFRTDHNAEVVVELGIP